MFIDLFGHDSKNPNNICDADGYCGHQGPKYTPEFILRMLGVKKVLAMAGVENYNTSGWSPETTEAAAVAVIAAGQAFENAGAGETWYESFQNVYGPMRFVWGDNETPGQAYNFSGDCAHFDWGCSPGMVDGKQTIAFNSPSYYNDFRFTTLVMHELGHIFGVMYGGSDYYNGVGKGWMDDQLLIFRPNRRDGGSTDWRHSSNLNSPTETFADMFTAWVYGAWNTSNDPEIRVKVADASYAMNVKMDELIP